MAGGRPPRCRAARGAGRPAAGRPAPGTCLQFFFVFFLRIRSCRPTAGQPGPGHPTARRQGFFCKNFVNFFVEKPLNSNLQSKNFSYLQSPARKSGRASPLSLPLSFFFISGIVVMQMRGGGTSQPLYRGGRAGRPAAGRPGGPAAPLPGDRPQGPVCNFFLLFLHSSPCRPAAGRPGYTSVNFQIENIFL